MYPGSVLMGVLEVLVSSTVSQDKHKHIRNAGFILATHNPPTHYAGPDYTLFP